MIENNRKIDCQVELSRIIISDDRPETLENY